MLNEKIEKFDEIANISGLFFVWKSLINGIGSFSSLSKLRSHHSGKLCLNLLPAILLLEEMGYITFDGESINLIKMPTYLLDEKTFSKYFGKSLLDFLLNEDVISSDCITYNSQKDKFILSRNGIRYKHAAYRNLLLSFGILSKSNNGNYFFEKMIDSVIKITSTKNQKKTEEDLLKELKRKRQEGLAGELFVIEFERKRLYGHTNIDKIKQISTIDVTAGYDIISYEDISSTSLDRYIEVKTYKGKPHFHWSSNEIKISKIRSEHYYLYLVDYEKIKNSTYKPIIIQDPSSYFINNDEWICSPESFLYESINKA